MYQHVRSSSRHKKHTAITVLHMTGGTALPVRPIETVFPTAEVNKIAEKESTGFGRRHYRPVYVMHKWWARRLGSVFRAILLYTLADNRLSDWDQDPHSLWGLYSRDVHLTGKVVLDPMMGGGTTVVEALRLGCRVIAGDLNPVSWFVVKKEIEHIDPCALEDSLVELERDVGTELRKYYRTVCPECGGDAEGIYYFHCKELECLDCGSLVPLMKSFFLARLPSGAGDVVVCPCCWEVFKTSDSAAQVSCIKCGTEFVPRDASYTSEQEYSCPNDGCRPARIVDAIRNKGRPKERMYAIEFYCRACDESKNPRLSRGRGYKKPDTFDYEKLEQAKREFEKDRKKLPIPDARIPIGVETRRALNHGYLRFEDLFSARQLLNLGKIYRWILNLQDWNLKEFLVLALSNCLKYNNMLCKYNATRGFITDIFRTHSYSPSTMPVEGNCYDTQKGRGPFTAFVRLIIEAKRYCEAPFERVAVGNNGMRTVHFKTPIIAQVASDYKDFQERKNVLLICGSSSKIDAPDGIVDAVITDPPYADNVMYSELSNFFYVWLRLALRERYQHFVTETVPWEDEVILNRVQRKGDREFLEGLTSVFSEANRMLRTRGLLVFTFHHKSLDGWTSVLQSVLNSGFLVTAAYAVRSEMKTSTHLHLMNNIKYDIILVCRKRSQEPAPKAWSAVKRSVGQASKRMIEDIEATGEKLSSLDMFVMTLGKCLEHYSKHYPNVFEQSQRVGVREALSSIVAAIGFPTSGPAPSEVS